MHCGITNGSQKPSNKFRLTSKMQRADPTVKLSMNIFVRS